MNLSRFFIDRPIFAGVLSVLMLIAGLVALRSLPISEYPEVAPPSVVVRAQYPGANPKVIAETVATPPSVPGLRLEKALERVLARKGVVIVKGRAAGAQALKGAVKAIIVGSGAAGELVESLEARAFVLAGGRFLGGGIREANRVMEPLFDLPIFHHVKVTSALPFDLGVDLVVIGLCLMAFVAFGEDDPTAPGSDDSGDPPSPEIGSGR